MDTLFENSYERNGRVVREFCKYTYFLSPLYMLMDICLILALAANFFMYFFGGKMYIYVVILVPLIFAAQYIMYKMSAKSMLGYDNGREQPTKVTTVFTEDKLICDTSTGTHKEFNLSIMKSLAQTENLLLLKTKSDFTFILPKNGFTKGNAEDFAGFAAKHGIKTRIKN